MTHDIDRRSKAVKSSSVSVSKIHLLTIPECIVIVVTEVDISHHLHSFAIDRVPLVNLVIKIPGSAKAIVRLVNFDISSRWCALYAGANTRHLLMGRPSGYVN